MGIKIEEEWRYRKVKSERASKSAFAFKINKELKQQKQDKMSYGYGNIIPYSKEVIVKITGGARSKKGIKNTVSYISENWQEEIIDSTGIRYKTKEEMESAVGILQENVINNVNCKLGKELKLAHNIVFSAPKVADVKREHVLEATVKTLLAKYPDNYFVAAYHDETDNPHVHVVLNINKDCGERIDIRKNDLRDIRESFSKNLIDYGYDVKASRKYENEKNIFESKHFKESLLRENRNIYEVVDFGSASYNLDKKNNKNGYITYKTANEKEVTIWGKEILDEMVNKNIKKGDLIKIKKIGDVKVKVPVYGSSNKEIIGWKKAKRNRWNIEKAEINTDNRLNLNNKINMRQDVSDHIQEIELDDLERAAKQLQQREKFEDKKKFILDGSYREKYKLESGLKYKQPKKNIRF